MQDAGGGRREAGCEERWKPELGDRNWLLGGRNLLGELRSGSAIRSLGTQNRATERGPLNSSPAGSLQEGPDPVISLDSSGKRPYSDPQQNNS